MTRAEQLSENVTLYLGDCRDVLPTLSGIDAVVTDPPYGLSFMGKKWDYDVPSVEVWRLVLEAIKPGAHLLSFAGTRTQHRMAVNIEDAGFDIRDLIAWVYGSGFPKSLDVSKAIDKAAGAEREVVGPNAWAERGGLVQANTYGTPSRPDATAPATEAARQWDGWGTALKPALEPVTVARKPLVGTVAENVLRYRTGAINIEGCRVATSDDLNGGAYSNGSKKLSDATSYATGVNAGQFVQPPSRFPANLIHDGSEEVAGLFPYTTSGKPGVMRACVNRSAAYGAESRQPGTPMTGFGDSGSAARFFKRCPPDATCPLCCLPYAEACNTMRAWKNTLASIAEKRGWTSQATSEFIARVSAIGPASERVAPLAKSAGSLCDSCAISIAVALVATKTSAFSSEELQAILASTGNCNASILIPSLASFAELWVSIDTIPTTNSLSLLFGSVRDAIASFTRQATRAKAEPGCEPSRFAYIPKASKADRDEGCEGLEAIHRPNGNKWTDQDYRVISGERPPSAESGPRRNHHPTVKPTALMRYLCRLITPPGGVVLDPFMGSGSTGKAAILEGFGFVGIERDPEYFEIACRRIAAALKNAAPLPAVESPQLAMAI